MGAGTQRAAYCRLTNGRISAEHLAAILKGDEEVYAARCARRPVGTVPVSLVAQSSLNTQSRTASWSVHDAAELVRTGVQAPTDVPSCAHRVAVPRGEIDSDAVEVVVRAGGLRGPRGPAVAALHDQAVFPRRPRDAARGLQVHLMYRTPAANTHPPQHRAAGWRALPCVFDMETVLGYKTTQRTCTNQRDCQSWLIHPTLELRTERTWCTCN